MSMGGANNDTPTASHARKYLLLIPRPQWNVGLCLQKELRSLSLFCGSPDGNWLPQVGNSRLEVLYIEPWVLMTIEHSIFLCGARLATNIHCLGS